MTKGDRRVGYIAYIDEAGDDGLSTVRPIDQKGSSEWLILSAVVIRSERENEIIDKTARIIDKLRLQAAANLHFSKLSEHKREFVCQEISELNCRIFVICSNKKNMRRYKNPFAEQFPSKNWYYCWLTRILLERVTDFVNWRTIKDFGEVRKLRVEYSNRGGLSYAQMGAYYKWLQIKSNAQNLFTPFGDLKWPVIDHELFHVYNHKSRAGLQLADVVASSFFKECDVYSTGKLDSRFAKLLSPRIAKYRDKKGAMAAGYGVKLLPSFYKAQLLANQKEIFEFYGYPEQWWDPDPSNPAAFRPATPHASRPTGRHAR